MILGIETSCDETAAAVLEPPYTILSDCISSQVDVHSVYGGVVPELASRHHLRNITFVVEKALKDAGVGLDAIEAVAVTQGPGLIGALVVGFSFAKSIAITRGLPLVGVNHIHAHLNAIHLEGHDVPSPYIGLVVSGGHTSLYLVKRPTVHMLLGTTRDDAAGEAFDKVAKVLDLPYPGGPVISRLAESGDPKRFSFPRAWLRDTPYDFSFSGLKTAVITTVKGLKRSGGRIPVEDIAASFQEAVVEILSKKAVRAALDVSVKAVVLSGGVASNLRLREVLRLLCEENGLLFLVPAPSLCTDNAAMVAGYGFELLKRGKTLSHDADVYSRAF